LTRENIAAGQRLLKADGEALVALLVDVSLAGRAPKVQPTIFLLAAACASDDLATKTRGVPGDQRDLPHRHAPLTFCRYVEQFRGWGRGLRSAVANWYFQDTQKLALQAVKYASARAGRIATCCA